LDLLKEIDKNVIFPDDLNPKLRHGAIISFSISTLPEDLIKILQWGAPKPEERLETMKKCQEEGFLTGAVSSQYYHSCRILKKKLIGR